MKGSKRLGFERRFTRPLNVGTDWSRTACRQMKGTRYGSQSEVEANHNNQEAKGHTGWAEILCGY